MSIVIISGIEVLSMKKTGVLVGSRIKKRRTELKMSQIKLSEALGVSYQQVQRYENGTNLLDTDRLIRVAEVLDVPVSYFFEEAKEKAGQQIPMSLSGEEARLITMARGTDKKVMRLLLDILKMVKKII
jgi:transcriptional regulator with XRE-family HTH domain